MIKPADFFDDPNQQRFYTLERLHGIPDFVKNSAAQKKADLGSLPSHVFADILRRKFPCHTKAATWLSQAYFTLCQGGYSKKEASAVQDRITKAAKYFNILTLTDAFRRNWTKLSGASSQEVKRADYGLVVDYDGHEMKLFPMPNAVSVKMAGEYLFANRYQYPYLWRKTAARNILKKAMEYDRRWKAGEKVAGAQLGILRFDTDTREYLEKAAGFGASTPQYAAEKIATRVLMIPERFKEIRVKMASLARTINDMPQERCTPAFLQKISEALDSADRTTGVCNRYHEGVDLPEEMLFQLLAKHAQSILENHVTLTTGNTYPVEALRYIPLDKVAAVMGQEFVDAIVSSDGMSVDTEKAAAILPTLPRNDAALLERVLSTSATEELDKAASLKSNPFSRQSGDDPFSRESMLRFFKDKGYKPRDLRYTLAIPMESK